MSQPWQPAIPARIPAPGAVATPDPDEPVLVWEVTGCLNCGHLLHRVRRRNPGPWIHEDDGTSCEAAVRAARAAGFR